MFVALFSMPPEYSITKRWVNGVMRKPIVIVTQNMLNAQSHMK